MNLHRGCGDPLEKSGGMWGSLGVGEWRIFLQGPCQDPIGQDFTNLDRDLCKIESSLQSYRKNEKLFVNQREPYGRNGQNTAIFWLCKTLFWAPRSICRKDFDFCCELLAFIKEILVGKIEKTLPSSFSL